MWGHFSRGFAVFFFHLLAPRLNTLLKLNYVRTTEVLPQENPAHPKPEMKKISRKTTSLLESRNLITFIDFHVITLKDR